MVVPVLTTMATSPMITGKSSNNSSNNKKKLIKQPLLPLLPPRLAAKIHRRSLVRQVSKSLLHHLEAVLVLSGMIQILIQ
jgi:hypothetical protein